MNITGWIVMFIGVVISTAAIEQGQPLFLIGSIPLIIIGMFMALDRSASKQEANNEK